MEEKTFKDGKLDGVRKLYYDTGVLKQTEEYQNDILNGRIAIYSPDGSMEEEVFYRKGIKVEKEENVVRSREEEEKAKLEEAKKKEGLTDEELSKIL